MGERGTGMVLGRPTGEKDWTIGLGTRRQWGGCDFGRGNAGKAKKVPAVKSDQTRKGGGT